MLLLLKGCTGNNFPTDIICLDECLFLSIGECGRLVRCNEDTRDMATWGPLKHPNLKRRCWDMLKRTPLQVLVMFHVKWALCKVACNEYSTSNNYTHIIHNVSMHCLWLSLHQRVALCQWLLQQWIDQPDYLRFVLFTDNTSFQRDDAQLEDMAQWDCHLQCRPRYLQQNIRDGVTLLQREGLPHAI